jgi:hypothetical protein
MDPDPIRTGRYRNIQMKRDGKYPSTRWDRKEKNSIKMNPLVAKKNYGLTFTICHTSYVWHIAGKPAATSSSFSSLK